MEEKTYFLTTKRLGFSQWKEGDMAHARALWGETQVTRFICASGIFREKDIVDRLHVEIQNQRDYGVQYWPVFSLASGEFLGCCGLRPHGEMEYELGVHLRPGFWRQGYGKEAAGAAIDYGFGVLKARKLFAGHNPKNLASRKLLSSLGFSYVGDVFYEPTGLFHPSYELERL